jgi:hypothetical protein
MWIIEVHNVLDSGTSILEGCHSSVHPIVRLQNMYFLVFSDDACFVHLSMWF